MFFVLSLTSSLIRAKVDLVAKHHSFMKKMKSSDEWMIRTRIFFLKKGLLFALRLFWCENSNFCIRNAGYKIQHVKYGFSRG